MKNIIKNLVIEYTIKYSKRKTLGITVTANKEVLVTAPFGTPKSIILDIIKKRTPWINKKLVYFEKFHPLTEEKKYFNGEKHMYLGKKYKLKLIKSEFNYVSLQKGYFLIYTNDNSNIKKLMTNWYRKQAQHHFEIILQEALQKFKDYNIDKPVLKIKLLKRRWGSCSTKGNITFNLELIKAPKKCIKYIAVHEICHIIHPDHSKYYYKLLEMIMPDWKKWKITLEHKLS